MKMMMMMMMLNDDDYDDDDDIWLGSLVVKTSARHADGRGSILGLDTTR